MVYETVGNRGLIWWGNLHVANILVELVKLRSFDFYLQRIVWKLDGNKVQ